MLKLLPSSTFGGSASARCGEIYYHSSREFTIVCSLCGLKAFHYEEFLVHCKNVHLEYLLRTEEVILEVTPSLVANVKDELIMEDNSDGAEFMAVTDFDMSLFETLDTGTQNKEGDSHDWDEDFTLVPDQKKLKEVKSSQTETYKSEVCSHTYKSHQILHQHLDEAHYPEMQICEECPEEFKTLRSLEDHCLREHGGIKSKYFERRLASRTNQLRHIETLSLFETLDTRAQNKEGNCHDWDEDLSPVPVKKKVVTFQHKKMKGRQTETYKCEVCSYTNKSQRIFCQHLDEAHYPEMQICEQCPEEFKTLRGLEDHCQTEHGGIKSKFCERRLTSRTNQLRHIATHTRGTERRFACDNGNCTERFFTRRQYQDHKRTHTRAKNFVCYICGYSCRAPQMLKVHYRSHTGEKPYACKECGKRFISKSADSEHAVTHGTDPHVSKVSDRSFVLEEKKFKCEVCGKAYAALEELTAHMRRYREDGECRY